MTQFRDPAPVSTSAPPIWARGTNGSPVATLATVSELKSVSVALLSDGDTRLVRGYREVEDRAAGLFWWDADSDEPDDGGTILNPTGYTGTGRWKRADISRISPELFGAVGDGESDDSSEVAAALAYGGKLVFGGVYGLEDDVEIPDGVLVEFLPGAAISVGSGYTLTVSGEVQAGHHQIFTGAGSVVFSASYQGETKPAWFGDITTDAGECINAWHAAVNSSGMAQRNSRVGILPAGVLPVLTPIDLQDEGGDNLFSLTLRGQGGIAFDALVEQHRYDGTTLDCSGLDSGYDGFTVGTAATLPSHPASVGTVKLSGFCIYGAPQDGLVISASGSRLDLDDIEVHSAGRHGFNLQDPHGGFIKRIQAHQCGGSGFVAQTFHAVNCGELIVRECGSDSTAGSYPAFVLHHAIGSHIDMLYVESNYSAAGKLYGNLGLNIGAIYAENNNRGEDGEEDPDKVWHIYPESDSTLCSVTIGQLYSGADVASVATGYLLVESLAASYYAGVTILGWTGSGGLSGDWLVFGDRARVEIHNAQGLTYDLSGSGGDSGLVLINPRATPLESHFTLGTGPCPSIAVIGAVNTVDTHIGIKEITTTTTLVGHETMVMANATGGAVSVNIKNLKSNRNTGVTVVKVDGSGNAVTVTDGDGVAVRGVSSLAAKGDAATYRYLQNTVESVWYGY